MSPDVRKAFDRLWPRHKAACDYLKHQESEEGEVNHDPKPCYRLMRVRHDRHCELCYVTERMPNGYARVLFRDGATAMVHAEYLVEITEFATPAPDLCAKRKEDAK